VMLSWKGWNGETQDIYLFGQSLKSLSSVGLVIAHAWELPSRIQPSKFYTWFPCSKWKILTHST
jgi:hypothetical protein